MFPCVRTHVDACRHASRMHHTGFKYLYLTPDDFKKVASMNSVKAELVEEDGEARYKITDIIGKEEGLGVENLKWSGTIAGESSQAYNEVVTISMVTCRAIGIGAYLVRLGQRVVQVDSSHIILTGCGALNKLLGREVYTSNNQLGGVQIMFHNGVSHATAKDDLDGIHTILKWLSYIPKVKGGSLPTMPSMDPVDRDIMFTPTKSPYDPRHMLAGRPSPVDPNVWESGFFDKDSWDEILGRWAGTVVTGRARLGGIPVGVIAVETRTVEVQLPADPANIDSEAKIVSQAGQVWFPDSAYKTSQVIKDFNRENLPLFVFANWRGFSGGMKDMFDQVVKFGAYIVDGFREYRQPIIVYIPPYGELRGGAWVVIDPTINADYMEMYVDPNCRGGVLEAEGTVEIKFKMKDQVKAMHRLDPVVSSCLKRLGDPNLNAEEKKELGKAHHEREHFLSPIYHQVAVHFADLHDTAERMHEKGVVQDIVPWVSARRILYWRLRRLLAEGNIVSIILDVQTTLSRGQAQAMLRRWFIEDHGSVQVSTFDRNVSYLWEDNEKVGMWLEEQLKSPTSCAVMDNVRCIRRESVLDRIRNLLLENPEVSVDSIIHAFRRMSTSSRAEMLRTLNNLALEEEEESGKGEREGSPTTPVDPSSSNPPPSVSKTSPHSTQLP
ncbi:unnamed protein product [Darwinula stevensoni]|uniref:Acetyl-CoA carboxylase n=1 Tax=Darwinula stevensoni TaxID=69355 RepID=A0A7R8XGL2_9CRUS|nr:unnamed protein product [Darwinula stevensoni]CAG0896125.1 unnamed protein product [Darwinula stevensoni]